MFIQGVAALVMQENNRQYELEIFVSSSPQAHPQPEERLLDYSPYCCLPVRTVTRLRRFRESSREKNNSAGKGPLRTEYETEDVAASKAARRRN
jgi:hypothetical protein